MSCNREHDLLFYTPMRRHSIESPPKVISLHIVEDYGCMNFNPPLTPQGLELVIYSLTPQVMNSNSPIFSLMYFEDTTEFSFTKAYLGVNPKERLSSHRHNAQTILAKNSIFYALGPIQNTLYEAKRTQISAG